MPTEFTVRLREQPPPAQLVVTGEIDMHTIIEFRAALTHAVARHDRLVVDLTGTGFLSGAALEILAQHTDHTTALLVTHDSPITRALHIAGLATLLAYRGTTHAPRKPASRPTTHHGPPVHTRLTS
jgi:anti-anti-sigma factor